KLESWGTLTGRLVTPEGKPPKDIQILSGGGTLLSAEGVLPRDPDKGFLLQPVRPDKDGKFRIEGLVPGLKYNLLIGKGTYSLQITGSAARNVTIKAGETKDLGEIQVKAGDE